MMFSRVAVLAGYSPTPYEEMTRETLAEKPPPKKKPKDKEPFDKSKLSTKKKSRSESQKNTVKNMAQAKWGKDIWVEKLHDLVTELKQDGLVQYEASAEWSSRDASEIIETLIEMKSKEQNEDLPFPE